MSTSTNDWQTSFEETTRKIDAMSKARINTAEGTMISPEAVAWIGEELEGAAGELTDLLNEQLASRTNEERKAA